MCLHDLHRAGVPQFLHLKQPVGFVWSGKPWARLVPHSTLALPNQVLNECVMIEEKQTPCECVAAGWCERHRFRKTTQVWTLCRTRPDIFEKWERGEIAQVPVDDPEASSGPGFGRRVLNFGRAVIRHALDGAQHVSDSVLEERLEICRQCSSCDLEQMVCREKSCGCRIGTKAKWRSESCPLGRWPPVTD